MRGKRRLREPRPAAHRNIPAYAGKTNVLSNGVVMMSEHPRVCGENAAKILMAAGEKGTSPRMRGKLHGRPTSPHDVRNIPAYAGKTEAILRPEATRAGTSPRMRGKLDLAKLRHSAGRNIPAYAGKTLLAPDRRVAVTEHPRVCGENRRSKLTRMVGSGTSPRMRGKQMGAKPAPAVQRNIPAYAGKTQTMPCTSPQHPEHPRVCGENLDLIAHSLGPAGTSPRMRGKHRAENQRLHSARNIPAYAGKT